MTQLRLHPQFKRDVAATARYYEREQAGLGDAFRNEVLQAIDRAFAFPLSGSLVEGNIRRQMLQRFPYHILYQVSVDEEIFILGVSHQRRRPGHWRRRL